jgi:hypothetical protein
MNLQRENGGINQQAIAGTQNLPFINAKQNLAHQMSFFISWK